MAKTYTNQTTLGEFETLAYGDRVWPEAELRNWQKIENRLLASGINNYAETLGVFSLSVGSSVTSGIDATLTTSGVNKAFSGGLGGYFFQISDTITFLHSAPIDETAPWYLYIKKVTGAVDPLALASIETEVTQTLYSGSDLDNRLLVATLTVSTGLVFSIDLVTTGKQEFRSHIASYQDPHGSLLEQTVLKTQVLKFDNGSYVYPEYIGSITFPTTDADQVIEVSLSDVITIPTAKVLTVFFVSCNRLSEVSLGYDDNTKTITFTSGSITGSTTFSYFVKYFLSDSAQTVTVTADGNGDATEIVDMLYVLSLTSVQIKAIVVDKPSNVDVVYDTYTNLATFSVHDVTPSVAFTFNYFVIYSEI